MKKFLILSVVFVLTFSSFSTSLVYAVESGTIEPFVDLEIDEDYIDIVNIGITDLNNIPEEVLDPNHFSADEIIYIPEEFFDPYHEDVVEVIYDLKDENTEGIFRPFIALEVAAGSFFIPGIGTVVITTAGTLVIAGLTIKAGSILYNEVATYFAKKSYDRAKRDGAKTKNHSTQTVAKGKSSLPKTGKPLSSKDLKDGKGVKQRRYYNKKGNAELDIDYRHSGNYKFPHRHTWKNGVRSKH
ncbi:hypothetical protein [Amphibacillus jilinensis]|uniref:hypothetical protein n=1 Tax=Amphibacillus jilinensis TaxID=1216008 RepID=UPI0002F0ADD0|nr:hypothetical protein [Amphibacillus jilinensis]